MGLVLLLLIMISMEHLTVNCYYHLYTVYTAYIQLSMGKAEIFQKNLPGRNSFPAKAPANYHVNVKYTASGSALISLIKRYSPAASRPASSSGISTVS